MVVQLSHHTFGPLYFNGSDKVADNASAYYIIMARGDDMTLLRCIILLQFTAALALGQTALKRKALIVPRQPEAMVRSLYREVVARKVVGIPSEAKLAPFIPYLSKALLHRIELAIACSDDWDKQHPDPLSSKPPFAWLESGLFSGDDERASPRTYHIEGSHRERDGSLRVYVRLTWGSSEDRFIWRVAVIVVREDGRSVVDDVIYLKEDDQDVDRRLSQYLSAGCNGPHLIGYSH
jgi:hypothetical protein